MAYKLKWKKRNKVFISKLTFKNKTSANRKAKFLRQLDDDLPKSRRDKALKTIRVIKIPQIKKFRRS